MSNEKILDLILSKYSGDEGPLLKIFSTLFVEKTPSFYRELFYDGKYVDFVLDRFMNFLSIVKSKTSVKFLTEDTNQSLPGNYTFIDVAVSDSPFVVETALSCLSFHQIPILGSIRFCVPPASGVEGADLSYSLYVVESLQKDFEIQLETSLRKSIGGVRIVTCDFREILDSADAAATLIIDKPGTTETINLIRWLKGNNFIYLGAARVRESTKSHKKKAVIGTGLLRPELGMQQSFLNYAKHDVEKGIAFVVTNEISFVHKFENIILVRIKISTHGEEFIIIGNFSSSSRRLEFSTIPVIREKVYSLLGEKGYVTNSYDYKHECAIFHKIPIEELFALSSETIKRITSFLGKVIVGEAVLQCLHHDTSCRHFAAVITLPDNIFTPELFSRLKDLFKEELTAPFRSYKNNIDGDRTIIHFYANVDDEFVLDEEKVKKSVADVCRSQDSRILDELKKHSEDLASSPDVNNYLSALPLGYKNSVTSEFAAIDFIYSRLFNDGSPLTEVYVKKQRENAFILRVFSNYDITLSETMPILNSFGFEVINSDHFSMTPAGKNFAIRIKTFDVVFPYRLSQDFEEIKNNLTQVLIAALNHLTHVDPLNQLSVKRGLSHTKLKLIRAYRNLLIQYSGNLKVGSINNALIKYEGITEKVLQFFEDKFSPHKERLPQVQNLQALEDRKTSLNKMLLDVSGIQDDRILRSIITLVDASLRTNVYITRKREFETNIAIKIDPKKLDFAVDPKPDREIFVYDLDMEGIHLRGGKIARGGIRFSDRTDDYRTEVLGLMKTQMVKNTIIVPVGSKGGFIVKPVKSKLGQNRSWSGVTAYRKFIGGLLDITDNFSSDNTEIHPEGCVIYDDFDPYLVVAADKGTANFSDIANQISTDYGFWLKDAFASGGSNGYNHKEMGITARGAWECAKRHFRETGIDIQKSSVSVVGIGDMSGDVFGNAMLLSQTIKLVAAFNHEHIFIDPTPDNPAISHGERTRMFGLETSTWKDYDVSLISSGGGVFDRGAKAISLTSPLKDLLKTNEDTVNGDELIKLILKAPVDMIFHGGIGTYIKGSVESNPDVNDKANDNVRVDASEIHTKVIIEGGNLGITQKGRIEYEKYGGAINADAIDNSAGVDTSDHEVNIKILIESLKASGKITSEEEGNSLLEQCRDFVVQRVLGHNNQQSAIISMDRLNFLKDPTNFFDTLKTLESESMLNRKEDHIPGNGEIEQMIQSTGLPRSILSYIMGLEKIRIYNIISESEITKVDTFQKFLFEYFPRDIHEKYKTEILHHRLGKNIIANFLTNRVINRGGLALVHSLTYHSPTSVEQVIETYFFVYEILGAQNFRASAMKLEHSVKTEVLYNMLIRYEQVIFKMVKWILQQPLGEFVDFKKTDIYKEKIKNYLKEYFLFLSEISPQSYKSLFDEIEELKANNVPEELAKEAAYSIFLKPSLGLIRISEQTGQSIRMVAESNIIIGERFHLHYLHSCLKAISLKTEWEKVCHNAIKQELYWNLDKLVSKILLIPTDRKKTVEGEESPLSRIYKFLGIKAGYKRAEGFEKYEDMRREIIEKLEFFITENSANIKELDKLVLKLKDYVQASLVPIVVIEKFIANLLPGTDSPRK